MCIFYTGNRCELERARCNNPHIKLDYLGRCRFCPDRCPFYYDPVCGTNGKTYSKYKSLRCSRVAPNERVNKCYQIKVVSLGSFIHINHGVEPFLKKKTILEKITGFITSIDSSLQMLTL